MRNKKINCVYVGCFVVYDNGFFCVSEEKAWNNISGGKQNKVMRKV